MLEIPDIFGVTCQTRFLGDTEHILGPSLCNREKSKCPPEGKTVVRKFVVSFLMTVGKSIDLTPFIVQIIFFFWSFKITDKILRNHKERLSG